MKKYFYLFTITLFIFFVSLPYLRADEFEEFALPRKNFSFKATLYSKGVFDIGGKRLTYEDFVEWRNKLFVETSIDITSRLKLNASFRVDYNLLFSRDSDRGKFHVNPYEAYGQYTGKKYSLVFGKTTVNWGTSDVSILDIVNPRDFTEGPFLEQDFIKVPVLMIKFTYYINAFSELETVLVPFYRSAHFDIINSDWAVINPYVFEQNADKVSPDLGGIEIIRDGRLNPVKTDNPQDFAFPPEFGMRYVKRGEEFDLSALIFAGFTDLPLPYFNPDYVRSVAFKKPNASAEEKIFGISMEDTILYSKPFSTRDFAVLKPKYGVTAGGGISTDVKGYGIRCEVLSNLPGYFIAQNLEIISVPTFGFQVNVDKELLNGHLYFNVFYGGIVVPYTQQDLFLVERYNHNAGGVLRVKYDPMYISFDLALTFDLTFGDFMLSPFLTYDVTDSLQARVGYVYLYGGRMTPFGYYRDNSGLFTGVKWTL